MEHVTRMYWIECTATERKVIEGLPGRKSKNNLKFHFRYVSEIVPER